VGEESYQEISGLEDFSSKSTKSMRRYLDVFQIRRDSEGIFLPSRRKIGPDLPWSPVTQKTKLKKIKKKIKKKLIK
jgi:hypothetical protein